MTVWGKSPELGSPKGETKHASPELKEYTYKQEKVFPARRATGPHRAAETWVSLPAGPQAASEQI